MRGPAYHARTHAKGGTDPIDFGSPDTLEEAILDLTGLSAFWKLNEPTGATAALDSSGNGYDLTSITDTPSFGQTGIGIGPPGEQSVYLDGDVSHGDMLERGGTPAAMTNNFSAFGWLRRFGTSGLDDDTIVSRETAGSGWRLAAFNTDSYKLRLLVNNSTVVTSDTVLAASTWYMWAVVRNAGAWKLYIDAVAQTGTSSTAPGSATGFKIGARTRTNVYFQGHQSYVALVNAVLTAADITAIHDAATFAGIYPAGYVFTSDGAGNTYWAKPRIEVTY